MRFKSLFSFFLLSSYYLLNAQINPYYQQHVDYTMDIDVDVKKYTYSGKQKIIYTNNSPDTLDKFYMHLYWNAFQPNSMMDERAKALGSNADRRIITKKNGEIKTEIEDLNQSEIGFQKITSLTQNGKPLTYKVNGTILEIELAEPILPNTSTEFEMIWNAQIPKQIRRSGRNNEEGIVLSMTQWYPKVVEYDYEGWHAFEYIGREFHGVFGNFDVKISIDSDYVVACGGQIQNPNEVKGYNENFKSKKNKKSTYHFTAKNIHDFAWSADPDYIIETQQIKNGPLVYYIYQKGEKTQLWEEAKPKVQIFYDVMQERFGKYVYPTYSFIQGGDGGMEYGQCSLISGEAKSLEGLVGLMFHEGAHSWFQHMIATNESTRGWMDEGFTSYATDICMSKAFSKKYDKYPNPYIENLFYLTQYLNNDKPEIMGIFDDYYSSGNAFTMATYLKGEAFLVNLGYIVGEENLRKIMYEYCEIWKLKHPTERDFMHVAQRVSKMDLKWYFNYMIYTNKTIDYKVDSVEKQGNNSEIKLENKGEFPMPIDVMVELNNGQRAFYTIPLAMMRNEKKTDYGMELQLLPDWNWTSSTYSFTVPFEKSKIKQVVIDPTQRLLDINFSDNIYKN
ncbi:MAG: M1 family metallopeptidase [Flavobacteriales bacterium]|nr:M1 family metallopeptidase [Flavobacteriales bacterium]